MRGANMKKHNLTPDEYLKGMALFTMAQNYYVKAKQFDDALAEHLGYEDGYAGCISDAMIEKEGSFDAALAAEDIAVDTE